ARAPRPASPASAPTASFTAPPAPRSSISAPPPPATAVPSASSPAWQAPRPTPNPSDPPHAQRRNGARVVGARVGNVPPRGLLPHGGTSPAGPTYSPDGPARHHRGGA